MNVMEIHDWFTREVLPLDPGLTRLLRRSWRNQSEIADLRQEIYVRLCDAARSRTPKQTKPFLFAVARNLIIDLPRRAPTARLHVPTDDESVKSADMNTPHHEPIPRPPLPILQHTFN